MTAFDYRVPMNCLHLHEHTMVITKAMRIVMIVIDCRSLMRCLCLNEIHSGSDYTTYPTVMTAIDSKTQHEFKRLHMTRVHDRMQVFSCL